MKKKNLVLTLLPIAALVLEALPFGAVLNFASPDSEPIRKTFSYFSLVPFGYANFGPFITAILTCAILVLAFISVFTGKGRIGVGAVSIVAFAASLMPLMFGLSCFSFVGAMISALLGAEALLSFLLKDKVN